MVWSTVPEQYFQALLTFTNQFQSTTEAFIMSLTRLNSRLFPRTHRVFGSQIRGYASRPIPAAKEKYVPTSGTYPLGFQAGTAHVGVKASNTEFDRSRPDRVRPALCRCRSLHHLTDFGRRLVKSAEEPFGDRGGQRYKINYSQFRMCQCCNGKWWNRGCRNHGQRNRSMLLQRFQRRG